MPGGGDDVDGVDAEGGTDGTVVTDLSRASFGPPFCGSASGMLLSGSASGMLLIFKRATPIAVTRVDESEPSCIASIIAALSSAFVFAELSACKDAATVFASIVGEFISTFGIDGEGSVRERRRAAIVPHKPTPSFGNKGPFILPARTTVPGNSTSCCLGTHDIPQANKRYM